MKESKTQGIVYTFPTSEPKHENGVVTTATRGAVSILKIIRRVLSPFSHITYWNF